MINIETILEKLNSICNMYDKAQIEKIDFTDIVDDMKVVILEKDKSSTS